MRVRMSLARLRAQLMARAAAAELREADCKSKAERLRAELAAVQVCDPPCKSFACSCICFVPFPLLSPSPLLSSVQATVHKLEAEGEDRREQLLQERQQRLVRPSSVCACVGLCVHLGGGACVYLC